MRINTMNLGVVIGIAFALAACQGADGVQPAADEATGDAGGSAGTAGDGGASGSAGTAGSGDAGGTDGGDEPKCVPGLVNDCHCANGDDGVQTCKGDGTFEACKCEGGGSGGTSGSGGSAGSSGGSGGLPGCVPGESKDCRCVDLSDGTQQCASDGKFYGLCVCPDGTGGTSGSGGSAGEPGDGMVDVDFKFTLPTNAPSITTVVLWGILHADSGWGEWRRLCGFNSDEDVEAPLEKNGSTFSCTRTLPTGMILDLNVRVKAPPGTPLPSTLSDQWACYGVGTNCNSESCFAAYGAVKVDGTTLTVPADAVGNYGLKGCNFRIGIE